RSAPSRPAWTKSCVAPPAAATKRSAGRGSAACSRRKPCPCQIRRCRWFPATPDATNARSRRKRPDRLESARRIETRASREIPLSKRGDLAEHLDCSLGRGELLEQLRPALQPIHRMGEKLCQPAGITGFGMRHVTHAHLEILAARV